MDTWADSTKALFITVLKAVFHWAEQQQYLSQNPIKKLKRRCTGRRQRVLTPDERERVKAEVSEGFRHFLTALELTGCRPFWEAAKITAQDTNGRLPAPPFAISLGHHRPPCPSRQKNKARRVASQWAY